MVTGPEPDFLKPAKPMPSRKPVAPDLLLQEFESLADTPDAVPKLRALIFDLAIRGALVPQNPQDLPARKLVELAKAQMKEQRKPNRASNGDEPNPPPPFPPPQNWCWTRLDDLGDTAPRNDLPDKTEVGFAPMRLITVRFGDPISFESRQWAEVRKGFTHFADGDVVVAKITPCFENGKSGVIRGTPSGSGAGTTELHVFRPIPNCVIREYVLVFLKSPHFLVNGEEHMTGSAGQKRVPWEYFARTSFPLPPLPEQQRIVAKVEELLALCDELEARQQATREHRTRLVHSALDHLTSAKDEKDFRKQCSFILHNSSLILDSVPALRQAILSLAVQGRIVPQRAKEGAGREVLTRFSLRQQPDVDHILDERFPSQWAITPFSNLARIRSGVTKGRNLTGRETAPFPYLRVANVQRGYLELGVMKNIEIPVEELEKFRLEPNDLLITEGGDWDKVGRTAIWRGEIPDCIHQNHVFRGRLVANELLPEWFMLYFNSPVGRRYFETAAKQTTNLASINATELRGCPVPIPPMAEQARIVYKVQELMRWCDELESQLTTARTAGTRLLDATLHLALQLQ
jgi:type I restriction enzyme S subunit